MNFDQIHQKADFCDECCFMFNSDFCKDNILFANDDELCQMGPLTDDDLDIWAGLPTNERSSVPGQSPAMVTDLQHFLPQFFKIRAHDKTCAIQGCKHYDS